HAASAHASFANEKQRPTLKEWHDTLGHIDLAARKHLDKRGRIDVTDTTVASEMRCSVCKECKSETLSYGRGGRSSKAPGEVVHTDLEGHFHADVTGMKYFQVFVDEASRDKHVAGLEKRDAANDATGAYIDEMIREEVPIKCISGDGTGELGRSIKSQRMLTNRGIKYRNSPPRTPQSIGIAERAIQQLMRIARSQLVKAGRGEEYWFFTVADAAFKTSGMPHEYLEDETPCERLTGKPFNYDRLRTWGSECFVHQHKQQRSAGAKFHPYAKRGILVGHDRHSLCWYVWLIQESKLVKSSHIKFESEAKILDIMGELKARSSPDSRLRRPSRPAQRRRGENSQQHFESSDGSISDDGNFLATLLHNQDERAFCMLGLFGEIATGPHEPSTTTEALAGADADRWEVAMEDKMEGLWDQGTFTDDPSPHDKTSQEAIYIQIKGTADGAVERYKARLVARGFTHREGIDISATFSPVAGFDVMRTVLATAALHKWRVRMLDFTQAFLNAPLPESVWLQLPDKSVVKADKAISGLKQSAVQWLKELRSTILAEDCHSSHYDERLYYRQAEDGRVATLVAYVDDLLFSGDYAEKIQRMQTYLLARFKGRDLGVPDKLLGVSVTVAHDSITLDQRAYAESIVVEGMGSTQVRKTYTLLDPGMGLSERKEGEGELNSSEFPYARILGKLMFLAGMTRTDLSNSDREQGRRTATLSPRHWRGLQHVLRYLAGTLDICLGYGVSNVKTEKALMGNADSDWANDAETRRSVTGYFLLMNKSPIVWRSKPQASVTFFSSEAERTAMVQDMRHCIFIRGIPEEMGLPQDTTLWFCDNRSAIQATTVTGFNGRTRRVDIKLKCSRQYVEKKLFTVRCVPTSEKRADILTKRVKK
ncbi:unnamed protein product, partial [Sphacelaria rigidula]